MQQQTCLLFQQKTCLQSQQKTCLLFQRKTCLLLQPKTCLLLQQTTCLRMLRPAPTSGIIGSPHFGNNREYMEIGIIGIFPENRDFLIFWGSPSFGNNRLGSRRPGWRGKPGWNSNLVAPTWIFQPGANLAAPTWHIFPGLVGV